MGIICVIHTHCFIFLRPYFYAMFFFGYAFLNYANYRIHFASEEFS